MSEDVPLIISDIRETSYLSLTIKSKPSIDGIECVAYISGALETWVRFSLIEINPFSLILKVENQHAPILERK